MCGVGFHGPPLTLEKSGFLSISQTDEIDGCFNYPDFPSRSGHGPAPSLPLPVGVDDPGDVPGDHVRLGHPGDPVPQALLLHPVHRRLQVAESLHRLQVVLRHGVDEDAAYCFFDTKKQFVLQ